MLIFFFFFTATIGNEDSPGWNQTTGKLLGTQCLNMEMCSKQRESQIVQELVTLVHWNPASGGDRQAEKTRAEQEEKE